MKKLVIVIAIVSLSTVLSHALVEKRVLKDGTIVYTNEHETGSVYRSPAKNQIIAISSSYDQIINPIAEREGVDPYLIKCIIKVESDFNPRAVSIAGAMGLMQLKMETARYYNVKDPLDPRENLNAGIRHFKSLLKYFKNDVPLSLAAYHAGLGTVSRRKAIPPIKATIDYVNKVMGLYSGQRTVNYSPSINKLYKRIDKEGDIIIYSR